MEHLEGNGLLSNLQHGFRHRKSCETQLLQFIDDLARGVCDGDQFDRAIMDFSNAFDPGSPISKARPLWNKRKHPCMDQIISDKQEPTSCSQWREVYLCPSYLWGPPRLSSQTNTVLSIHKQHARMHPMQALPLC